MANNEKIILELVKATKLLIIWILIIVIEKPIQFTMVKAVPLSSEGAFVFIAGAANQMPKDVKRALRRIAEMHGGMNETAAAEWLTALEARNRLQCETWWFSEQQKPERRNRKSTHAPA